MMNEIESFGGSVLVPAIVWVEYLSGLRPANRTTMARSLERGASFIGFDRTIADEAIRLVHESAAMGRPMSWTDLQVAATARALHEELVSNDAIFDDIAGLTVHRY